MDVPLMFQLLSGSHAESLTQAEDMINFLKTAGAKNFPIFGYVGAVLLQVLGISAWEVAVFPLCKNNVRATSKSRSLPTFM